MLSTTTKRKDEWTSMTSTDSSTTATSIDDDDGNKGDGFVKDCVSILDQGDHWLVVAKPPGVVCHHSDWTGSRSRNEDPMVQRVRRTLGGRRINLVHRLDRGSSGCLLMTFAEEGSSIGDDEEDEIFAENDSSLNDVPTQYNNSTHALSVALKRKYPETNKTYIALVRGNGMLQGRVFAEEGWFKVDRPIRNVRGTVKEATTWFRFIATGQEVADAWVAEQLEGSDKKYDSPAEALKYLSPPITIRASLVLARPETGRWHQIRRHLSGLSHPILGDSTHGVARLNRELRDQYGLPHERTLLHLAKLQLPPIEHYCPDGINVTCPLHEDMWTLLQTHFPHLWQQAQPILEEEGLDLAPQPRNST
ncbi:hypothetical protein ACA910_001341 [Epithemia clementina (nom. ined.)]